MSTLHSKSVIARAAFPFVRPRELSFNLPSCSYQILPLPAYVAPTENVLVDFFSFFYPSFPFYFYFTLHTHAHTHTTSRHTANSVNDLAVITLTESPEQPTDGYLFFRATSTRHAKKLQFQKQKTKKRNRVRCSTRLKCNRMQSQPVPCWPVQMAKW